MIKKRSNFKIKPKNQKKTLNTYLRKLKKIRAKFFLRKTTPTRTHKSQKNVHQNFKKNSKWKSLIRSLSQILRKHAIKDKKFKLFSTAQPLTKKVMSKIHFKRHRRQKSSLKLKTIKNQKRFQFQVYKQWASLSKNKKNVFFEHLRTSRALGYLFSPTYMIRGFSPEEFQQTLNRRLKRKYFKIKKLRFKLFSKLPNNFFLKANKWSKPAAPTIKQIWLEKSYQKAYFNTNNFGQKFRQDFLQTLLGKYFLLAHLSTFTPNGKRYYSNEEFFQKAPAWLSTISDQTKQIQINQKLGWYYTNLTRTKKVRQEIFLATRKTYPYKIFSNFWRAHKKTPWLDFLQSSRRMYTGLLARQRREQKWTRKYAWIPYLRKKKPTVQKRNKLYRWRNNLLFSFWTRGMIRKKKGARIKKVLSKTILPFYGHISEKQLTAIKKKVQRKKPESLSRDDLLLGHFERRLDVVVYRLNLAPNIFWARKLIKDGAVFTSSTAKTHLWEKVYAPLKKFIYPLKLRDPMNLYKKTIWTPFEKTAKMQFLLEPVKKIDYLVQPGEIIQCAPGALLNKFKTNSILWKKPIPKHFLTFSDLTETQKNWQYRKNKISAKATSENNHTIMATLLFPPSYQNLLKSDRVNREFMHWMTL